MSLTTADLERYEREGFVLIRGLIDGQTLERIDAHFCALITGETSVPEAMVIMNDVAYAQADAVPKTPIHAINKILSFENDPILWPFAIDERLLACVRDLIGHDLKTLSTNVINKPPGVDGRHPLHQDLRYFALRPADGIVGTWTAMDSCTREKGCLAVIPGSHRGPLAEHGEPAWEQVNSGFFAARDVDIEARVHVEMEAGDTLLFHPLLIHGSGRNRSDHFRRAISVHYASRACARPDGFTGSRPRKRRIAAAMKDIPSS